VKGFVSREAAPHRSLAGEASCKFGNIYFSADVKYLRLGHTGRSPLASAYLSLNLGRAEYGTKEAAGNRT
jgi:hypothetical protein